MADNDDLFPQPATPDPPSSRRRGSGKPVRFSRGFRRRWPRRVLLATNLFVAFCLIATVGAYAYVRYRVGQIDRIDVAGLRANGDTPASQPFTLLVVGSDSRALTGANNAQFGTEAQTPGQRSDTVMLIRVMPAAHKLSILSIPRDLWVPVAGMGDTRINSAFNNGANLLVSTITSDLGIPIDHYVEVNFDTFRQITDAVGGVKFWFPTPARDAYSLLSVPTAGCVNLTGNQALAFVRSRHYEYEVNGQWIYQAESDLARIQRQQAFVKKMVQKAETEFTNPIALNNIIGGVTKNLTVDQGFTTGFILSLAEQLHSVDAGGIPSATIPTYNFTTSAGAEVLGLQQPQASQMIAAFNTLGDTPSSAPTTTPGSASTSGGSTGTVAPSSISVEVANGTGVTGQATQAVSDLTAAGYQATVDTTPGSGFTTNVIRYAPDSEAAATQLQSQLTGGATLQEDSSLTATTFNLELITGQDFNGLTSTAASTSAAISGPTTTSGPTGGGTASALLTTALGLSSLAVSPPSGATLADSVNPTAPPATEYVLPGTPPGQLPPASCSN
jgi:LCP family protein required for cell wall assembly